MSKARQSTRKRYRKPRADYQAGGRVKAYSGWYPGKRLVNKAIDKYINSANDIYTTLRAISKTKEHPGKMWVKLSEDRMSKLLPFYTNKTPWSDQSYSTLPSTYIQNACLEIGSIKGILNGMPISGFSTIPFICEGKEACDINTTEDLDYANYLAKKFEI